MTFFEADAFVSFVFLISLLWKEYFFLVVLQELVSVSAVFLPVASSWYI